MPASKGPWIHVVPDTRPAPAADRLDSWKDIAAYLRRDVSTVQRWEKRQGLPVHRHLHDKQGSVYAFKSELDTWWRQGDHPADAADVDTPRGRDTQPTWLRYALVFPVMLAVAGAGWWLISRTTPRLDVARSSLPLPGEAANAIPAISPDGRHVVYSTILQRSAFPGALYVKTIEELDGRLIPGTDGGNQPFFSPDGNWIGYFAGGRLYKVATRGGAPVPLAAARQPRGATWLADDSIVYTPDHLTGLFRVTAGSATPSALTTPNRAAFERTHRFPSAVPGGHAVLFTVHRASADSYDDADIEAVRVATGERVLVLRGGTHPVVAPSGHLLYGRHGQIWAAPFDIARLRVTGPGLPVIDDVAQVVGTGKVFMTLSATGTLVYAPAGMFAARQLLWVDRTGRHTPVIDTRGPFQRPRISPDGRFVALEIDNGVPRVWLLDLERGTLTARTTGWDTEVPFWSPDGGSIGLTRIGFSTDGHPLTSLMAIPRDGTAEAGTVFANNLLGFDWSRDGSRIAGNNPRGGDISLVSARRPHDAIPLMRGPGGGPRFSPDGQRLAYTSNASGRAEVYVQELVGESRRWQISTDGGFGPVWSHDGEELFFRQMRPPLVMVVTIRTTPDLSVTRPQRLFEPPPGDFGYDVAPDGRFIFVSGEQATLRPSRLVMVQNWFEELRQKVPSQ